MKSKIKNNLQHIGITLAETIGFLFFVLALVFMSSCKNQQWAVTKLSKVEHFQPGVLAEKCANKYPPKVYDSTRTIIKKGETVRTTDTVTHLDTVTRILTRYVTNTETIRDTVENIVVRQVENTAKIDELTIKAGIAQANEHDALVKLKTVTSHRNWLLVGCILLFLSTILFIYTTFK